MILKYKKKSTAKQACLQKKQHLNLTFLLTEIQELQLKESFRTAELNCAWGLCAQIKQQALQERQMEVNTLQENRQRYRAMCWGNRYI